MALLEDAVVGIFRSTPEGAFLWINLALARLFGYDSVESFLEERGTHAQALYANPEDRRRMLEAIDRQDRLLQFEMDMRRRDGSPLVVRLSCRLVRDGSGGARFLEGFAEDVTTHRRAAEELETRTRELEALLAALPDAMLVVDPRGCLVTARSGSQMVLPEEEALTGHLLEEAFPPGLAVPLREAVDRVFLRGGMHPFEGAWDPRGQPEHQEGVCGPLDGERALCLLRDVTSFRRTASSLDIAQGIIDLAREGILVCGSDGIIEKVNPAFEAITGYSASEAVGRTPGILRSGRHDEAFYRDFWEVLMSEGVWAGEIWNRRKNGEVYPQWLAVAAVRDDREGRLRYVGVFSDLTELKIKDAQILHQAYHDKLTGLANRHLLQDRLRVELRASAREDRRLALLFLDLDRFKMLNSTLGYPMGDRVLVEVAGRLLAASGDQATVSRTGEDGFAVLLPDLESPGHAGAAAQRILEALQAPQVGPEGPVYVTASLGIAVYPEDGEEADVLIRKADGALYRAKARGGNGYSFATEELDRDFARRMSLEVGLRRALEEDRFLLYYQPILDPREGRVAGLEALLRWAEAPGRFVPPDEFIPLAEEIGLIQPLGDWVFRAALKQLRAWDLQGLRDFFLCVNVSPLQIREPLFLDSLRGALAATEADPRRLVLEITEQCLLGEREPLRDLFLQLHRLGVRIFIDDFGTGYSSLSYLKDFRLDGLKVDRSFLQGVPENHRNRSLVEAMLAMARGLGLDSVVEGVEEEAQLDLLRRLGYPLVQGFLFCRPSPADSLKNLLARGRAALPGFP